MMMSRERSYGPTEKQRKKMWQDEEDRKKGFNPKGGTGFKMKQKQNKKRQKHSSCIQKTLNSRQLKDKIQTIPIEKARNYG